MSYAAPGVLALNGQVQDQPSLTRAVETLRRDIPGLRELDNRATVAPGRTAYAATNAGSASDRPVSLAPRAPPPLAIKSVSLGAVRFLSLIHIFRRRYGADRLFRQRTRRSRPPSRPASARPIGDEAPTCPDCWLTPVPWWLGWIDAIRITRA